MSQLVISPTPHVKTKRTTKHIMLDVLIALVPATAASIVYFGWQAAVLILISLASAFLTEFVYYIIQNKIWANPKETCVKFFKQFDFTTLVTGLLLALCIPANINGWYMPLLGSIFAIAVVKMLFGGSGKNIVNPALAGRVFLFISFALATTAVACNFGAINGGGAVLETGATQLNGNILHGKESINALDLFLGTGLAATAMGETCKLALLVGGIYLCVRGVIKWYLPVIYIVVTGLFASLLDLNINSFLPSILSGGLMLGAIFMATDYVTTPKSKIGNIIYFVVLGLLTAGLRKATGVEVVSFCILLMNFVVFLIDLLLKAHPFGYIRKKKEKKVKETQPAKEERV
ncbi:MAG: RnfABCDGE type electron transport complex subunit D [Clostridia bacterium]|nr:RnfABCDGE type electron transport complex subunit D [Clostridia bacterium]